VVTFAIALLVIAAAVEILDRLGAFDRE